MIHNLQQNLLHPDLVAAYESEILAAQAEHRQDAKRNRVKLERKHAEASRKLERLAVAIANGADVPEIVSLAADMRTERDHAKAELANLDPANVVALLPGIADQYRREILALSETLDAIEEHPGARERFRGLISRVVLLPKPDGRGVLVKVEAHIDRLVSLAQDGIASEG